MQNAIFTYSLESLVASSFTTTITVDVFIHIHLPYMLYNVALNA